MLKKINRITFISLITLFIAPQVFAKPEIRISVLDTGFCIKKINHKNANKTVKIKRPIDLTESLNLNCKELNSRNKRFHGHFVLQEFLNNLEVSNNVNITITPFIVFNKHGEQKLSYWQKAFTQEIQNKTDIYLTATALITNNLYKNILPQLNSPIFCASGRIGPSITKQTKLWPNELAPNSRLVIIGSFYPPLYKDDRIYDKNLLYQKNIDYYFSSGKGDSPIKGSSKAVATALGKALTICSAQQLSHNFSFSNFKSCLLKKRKKLKTDRININVWSY